MDAGRAHERLAAAEAAAAELRTELALAAAKRQKELAASGAQVRTAPPGEDGVCAPCMHRASQNKTLNSWPRVHSRTVTTD